MPGVCRHSWPVWVVLALSGCTDPQPRAINSTPLVVSACLFACSTTLAVDAIEDSQGTASLVTTQTVEQPASE
jgi:hypothetical protein